MDLDKVIKIRKSVRRYSDKKPDWRKIIQAIDLSRYAPSAGNFFDTKFIIVSDKDKIAKLGEASQQNFVGTAEYIVVVISETVQLKRLYEERAEMFGRQQAGAAIENFLLKLTDLGLATCWVGYFEEREVRRVLSIPEKVFIEGMFPIGMETKIKEKQRPKKELDNLIYYDKYDNKFMTPKSRVSIEGA
jgi:nitroreductase